MKTKTINVYSFADLSPEAKEHAKSHAQAVRGYPFADDALNSLKALAAHFGGTLRTYEVDWSDSSPSRANFALPDLEESEIAARLETLGAYNPETLEGLGDCKLTGYCADETAIDGFRKAWHTGERDLEKLMQAAFDSWLKDAQADCQAQYEDNAFAEDCEANGVEFDKRGDVIRD